MRLVADFEERVGSRVIEKDSLLFGAWWGGLGCRAPHHSTPITTLIIEYRGVSYFKYKGNFDMD